MVVEGRALFDREPLEAGKEPLVLLETAHEQPMDMARLWNASAIFGTGGKRVAIEHRHIVEEIAQHAAGAKSGEASTDYHGVRVFQLIFRPLLPLRAFLM
jgi:hypothetical protein